jgi:EcsC protein family
MSDAPMLDADIEALRHAKTLLESPGLAIKLAGLIGTPFEKLLTYLPAGANDKVVDATQVALRQCLRVALRSLGQRGNGARQRSAGPDAEADAFEHALASLAPPKPQNWLHKLAVATTGAAGGAFGLLALPIELPVTTTLMFRSICDIARSEGQDLSDIDVQLECLTVLGMGGTKRDDAEFGYFFVRGALAQAVSKASSDIAAKGVAKGLAGQASNAVVRLINVIAARFSVQVSEQIAAKSIPAIGAVLGALINTAFIVRRLERKYGEGVIRAAYEAARIDSL